MKNKERIDILMVEQNLADSRSKAQAMIMAGEVYIGEQKIDKAGVMIPADSVITVRGSACPYVSRGGLKLEKALALFEVKVEGLCALDVGASTGGFTDCLLQNGAAKVYAVDAGEGQLAGKLLSDTRVVNMEKYNARNLAAKDFPKPPDVAVMDVSFISQTLILPALAGVLQDGGILISLIKPQFEAGRAAIGKNGLVKSAVDRRHAMERVLDAAAENGLACFGLDVSPILGGDGNVEYIAAFCKGGTAVIDRQKCKEIAEWRGEK